MTAGNAGQDRGSQEMPVTEAEVPQGVAQETNEERDLLMGLIFGAIHEQEIVGAAEFASKIAVCAKMTAGNQEEYSRAVKRCIVSNENVLDVFPGVETERTVQQFMRAIRRSRNNDEIIQWLAEQFMEPQQPDTVKQYLVAVERALANTLIGRH
jgi:hypothetical protein